MEIQPVTDKRQWDAFINLPWSIYRDDPVWVPPLRIAVRDLLNVDKNPFFRHARMRPLLALRHGEVVGRAAGIIDDVHNRYHDERTGFFGFYESVNDQAVCNALLDDVSGWVKAAGMENLRGPMNPSTNHECGLLVEGFDKPPRIMMTYNPTYYPGLLEAAGFSKIKDLQAWDVDSANPFTERLIKVADRQRRRNKITVHEVDMKHFDREIELIMDIYNHAWGRNWGFVPMDEVEFRHMAKDMKLIIDPRLVLIVHVDGVPAAFGLALPNINQALAKIRDGRLLPKGIFKLLWYFFGPGRRRTITESRILTLGIKDEFRRLGLGALLYVEYVRRSPAGGMPVGEASWILEDNTDMISSLEAMNAQLTRRYRIYQRPA
jgi:hypothetical protein